MLTPRFLALPVAAAMAVFLTLLAPWGALGHGGPVDADPKPGASLSRAPSRVRLSFSEPLQPGVATIEVRNSGGGRVGAGPTHVLGADGKSIAAPLASLPGGTYTVAWRVVTLDGAALRGEYAFSIGEEATTAIQSPSAVASLLPGALLRTLNYLAMVVLVGALGFGALVLVPMLGAGEIGTQLTGAVAERTLRIARVALGVSLVGALLSLAPAAFASSGPFAEGLRGPVSEIAGARDGAPALMRVVLLAALAALLLARGIAWGRRRPWAAGLGLGAGLLLTTSLSGHAASATHPLHSVLGGHGPHGVLLAGATALWLVSIGVSSEDLGALALPSRAAYRWWPWLLALGALLLAASLAGTTVALDWLHLAAASLWVGGLTQLALAVPHGLRASQGSERARFLACLIPRFSRLALPCVGALAGTGAYAAVVHVGDVAALTGTAYGLTVLAKATLFLPMAALGGANLYLGSERLRGRVRTFGLRERVAPRAAGFARRVRAELVLAALVLLATGVLTALPSIEGDGAGRSAAGSIPTPVAEGRSR